PTTSCGWRNHRSASRWRRRPINPPEKATAHPLGLFHFLTTERTAMTQDQTIRRALRILDARMRSGPLLSSPTAVRDYLRLSLHDRDHEVFVCIFLDAQHRVLACYELFRGTLAQTSVYPREVVKAALAHNAAAVILAHNHPSQTAEPSRADE